MIRLGLAALLVARIASADPDAKQLYYAGQKAFDLKDYEAAITAWQQSYDLTHESALLFNLAQAYRLRAHPGDCGRAAADYKEFVDKNPAAPQRELATQLQATAEACDAHEPHEVVVTPPPPPFAPKPPPPAPRPAPSPPSHELEREVGIAVAAAGVVLVGAGIYEGHHASTLATDVSNACANSCLWSDYASEDADGHRAQALQWIFAGAGVAAIAGGVVMWWRGREHAPAAFAFVPRSDGALATWSGAW